jgi:hypothetical protein
VEAEELATEYSNTYVALHFIMAIWSSGKQIRVCYSGKQIMKNLTQVFAVLQGSM